MGATGNATQPEDQCYQSAVLEAVPSQLGQWLLISLYTLTSLAALVGNVTVIVVERVGSESAHAIRKYLINLAVSDITIGVLCVPFAYTDFMLGRWIFPHWLCPTAQFVQLLSVFVTSLTLTAIGVERYFATIHPFSRVHRWLESHTHIIVSLTWMLGVAYAYVPATSTAAKAFELNNQTYHECSYDNNLTDAQRRLLMTTNLVLTFLLPLLVLILSYSAIMAKLLADERMFRRASTSSLMNDCIVGVHLGLSARKHSLQHKPMTHVELRKSGLGHNRSKTIKMMFMVIVLFGLCWMPIKVYQFCVDYHLIQFCTESQLHFFVTLYFACHWLAMANSFVNPIVYSFMSKSFRKDLRRLTNLCLHNDLTAHNKSPLHHRSMTISQATQV